MTPRGNGARFGLDLGRASVKLVRCDRDGVRGAERRVDPGLEEAARREALAAALREVGAELGARPGAVLDVGVPRAEAIVRRLVLPRVPEPELERMVRFQASKLLPFELDEVTLTWCVVDDPDARSEAGQVVVFAAVRRQALEGTRAVVEAAGYRVGRLEVSTQAAARTLALRGPRDAEELLLVDVGQASSDVVVLERGRLLFSRSASVGCGDDPAADSKWMDRLAQEVLRSLVAARTEESEETGEPFARERTPARLYLAGGGAIHEPLQKLLREQVGVEPALLSGLEDVAPTVGARFVVARGLADPRDVPGVPALDLARRAERLRAHRARARLLVVGALVFVVACAASFALRAVAARAEERRAALEREAAELAPAARQARLLQADVEQIHAWSRGKGRELEILLAVASALPEGERVYLTGLRWQAGRSLRLTGRAKDWDSVGTFLTRLEGHPLIAKASLDSVRRPRERARRGVDFAVRATLTPPGDGP
ncbi:MAG: hypothetical protein D6731_00265 [Planctomycetota bacterium]|nr:MAG: hypothetical protein D6731_00265 [Planctomycetota bacterium]